MKIDNWKKKSKNRFAKERSKEIYKDNFSKKSTFNKTNLPISNAAQSAYFSYLYVLNR